MKVLFINTVFGRGSTGRIVKELGDAIEADGGEYKVAFGRGDVVDKEHSYFIGSKVDRYIHAARARITDRAGFYSKRCTKDFVEFIRYYNPDIIHIHNLHGYFINIKILFEFLSTTDIPIVWTLHDCWPFTGHCVYYDSIGCEKWKNGCHHCPNKRLYPASKFLDCSRSNYTDKKRLFTGIKNMTLVTVSDWLKSQVEQSFLGKYPIVRIYNGVDRSIFAPVASSIRKKYNLEEKYIILGVSDGWSERKGLSFFKSLSKQLEEDEVIIMIGFKSQKEIKKLPSNIIAFCRTENVNQLVEFYSTADVVLNPSFEETFGMVTAEALCCGTPVIVQNKTACPELVDETCGCVLKDSLGLEIRRAVTELKQNRIETSACLKRTELFDKQNNYRYYVELYKTIMGRQN